MLGIFERIDALSKERKVSYKTLAEYLGFSSAQTFTNLKYNDSMPKADVAVKIAQFFGVTVEYLVTGETTNPLQGTSEDLSRKYHEILNKYESLKKQMQDVLDKG